MIRGMSCNSINSYVNNLKIIVLGDTINFCITTNNTIAELFITKELRSYNINYDIEITEVGMLVKKRIKTFIDTHPEYEKYRL